MARSMFRGLGAVVAVLLYMAGVPMLAFALGMYLPLSINLAVLAGAFTAWVVSRFTAPPPEEIQHLVEDIRVPAGAGGAVDH